MNKSGWGSETQGRRGVWVRAVSLERLERKGRAQLELCGEGGERVAVAVFALADGVYAIEDRCPHQYAPLSDGTLEGTVIRCAWHGWRFDVRTGRPPVGAFPCVKRFATRVREGWVEIDLDGGG